MQSTLSRDLRKIRRNLDGIRRMEKLPGALVVIDVRKETNAVREARALKIPTLCLIDTDGDPDFAALAIPGNDDAMRAIQLIVTKLADAVEEGRRARPAPVAQPEGADTGAASAPRRRSRRTTTSRAEPHGAPPAQVASAQPAPVEAPPVEAPPVDAPPVDAAVGVAQAAPTLAAPVPAPESLPESVGTSAGAAAEPAGNGGPAPTS
jgi:small subunit ribosomal protein S2